MYRQWMSRTENPSQQRLWRTEARATGRKPSTYENYRNTIRGFIKILGHDDAASVAAKDAITGA